MKRIMILIDGLADEACSILENKTPLEVARKKHINSIENQSYIGKVQSIPMGFQAMTEIGTLSLLGYHETLIPKGRGYFEAVAHNIIPKYNQTAFRCSFIHHTFGKVSIHAVENLTTSEALILIETLNNELQNRFIKLYPGKDYQHIALIEQSNSNILYPTPLDLVDVTQIKPYPDCLPESSSLQKEIKDFTKKALKILEQHPINRKRIMDGKESANGLLLWSPSQGIKLPTINELYGIKNAATITATPIIKGLSSSIGMRFIPVKEATGTPFTNYQKKGEMMVKALEQYDFVLVHIEACDEAAHQLNPQLKAQCIEKIDQYIISKAIDLLNTHKNLRVSIVADHGTSSETGKHLTTPTPFLIVPNPFKNVPRESSFNDKLDNSSFSPISSNQFANLFFAD